MIHTLNKTMNGHLPEEFIGKVKDKQYKILIGDLIEDIKMVDENEILSQYPDPAKAYIEIIMPIKAKHYIEYVQQRTLLGDIKIIFQTIFKIIRR